jgi:hypothetical protein
MYDLCVSIAGSYLASVSRFLASSAVRARCLV